MKTQNSKGNPYHELPMPKLRPYLKEFLMLSSANRRAIIVNKKYVELY
jgi:hypothetical protein